MPVLGIEQRCLHRIFVYIRVWAWSRPYINKKTDDLKSHLLNPIKACRDTGIRAAKPKSRYLIKKAQGVAWAINHFNIGSTRYYVSNAGSHDAEHAVGVCFIRWLWACTLSHQIKQKQMTFGHLLCILKVSRDTGIRTAKPKSRYLIKKKRKA